MELDHVVIWVEDPLRSLEFFTKVVGFSPVREAEYRDGKSPFPSVRVNNKSIIDLSPRSSIDGLGILTKSDGSAGHPVNHICIAMTQSEYEELAARLDANGVDTTARLEHTYGAQAWAPVAFYFKDLDGNVIEARYYDPADPRSENYY